MPLIDSRQRRWIVGVTILGTAATALYIPYQRTAPNGPTGSSMVGLAFGIAAAVVMLFETALNFRKRVPTWRIGRAETWMKGHIWLGLLAVPLVLFHSGFRFHGALAVSLTAIFFVLIASGLFGLALQQFLPRLMTQRSPGETIYEQIPHVLEHARVEAYEIAAAACGPMPELEEAAASEREHANPRRARQDARARPAAVANEDAVALRRFYLDTLRPFLLSDGRTGVLADRAQAERTLSGLCRALPPELHGAAGDLIDIAAERRDVAVQRRLHHWLHGWLLLHVPLTAAMLVLLAAHAFLALRYAF